ncbi:Choline-sulfatase [Planctomycetes bacterium Pan216]|uniref:Choline-sulfatase n=1 Tax=Kolteria novifilia TaxID=2527975 RepID=A0A518AZ55_9BACT|nr:Choline-sulfatase [Planctomycetes bacterium Pan216]
MISLFSVVALTLLGANADEAKRKPNVVFILTDDQRWDGMSCAGNKWIKTPNLDRLAKEGARFSNAFVVTSLCSPSRASFLSGRYAHSHHVLNNFTDYPNDLPSFPRQLQSHGYETAYIGKWHMGEDSDEKRPGFDYWVTHRGQGKYFDTEFNINGDRRVVPGYYTSVVTDMAVDWLKRDHEKPFLLILGQKAPHGPFVPEPKYEHALDHVTIPRPETAEDTGPPKPKWVKDRVPTWHGIEGNLYGLNEYQKFVKSYWLTIPSIDDSVGRVMDTLRETGDLDKTLIVFAGDNGFMLGEHGGIDKRCMYEDSIRIPMLMRYPKLIKHPPEVIEQMVLNIDVAPTILQICGVPQLEGTQGRSMVPLLEGDTKDWRKSFLYEYNYEKQFPYTPNVRGVRTDDWKYMHSPHGDGSPDRHKAEFYNLKKDPLETKNLIDDPASQPKLAELKKELARLLKETDALPDQMPVDEGIKTELPDEKIR